ncbi:MAG: gas vesicle protein, partial [Bacteroidota bacterium]
LATLSFYPYIMNEIDVNQDPKAHQLVLAEVLDRIVDQGVVISGDLIISVADVDLIYVGLRVLVSSVDRLEKETSGHYAISAIG